MKLIDDERAFGEVLNLLQEESAEVIQASSKIKRFGLESEWDKQSNKERLENEIGDLLCMVKLLSQNKVIDLSKVEAFSKMKEAKLKIWSPIIAEYIDVQT